MADLGIPYVFSNGSPSNANHVNDNFTEVKNYINNSVVRSDGSVKAGTGSIADDAVTAAKIAANAVGTSEIANDAVTADKVADGATLPVNITGNAATAGSAGTATNANFAAYAVDAGTATTAANSNALQGLQKSSGGYPNTISEVGSDGMVAAVKFGAAQTSSNWWYATDWGGTTLFRANIQAQPGGTYGVYNTPITTGRTVIIASTGTLGYQSSSQRYKDNINPVDIDVDAVLQVQPVTYQPKSEYLDGCESTDVFLGVIAEQVDELGLKHLVHYDEQGRPDSFKYDLLSVALLAVVKSQDARLSALEARIIELESK